MLLKYQTVCKPKKKERIFVKTHMIGNEREQ